MINVLKFLGLVNVALMFLPLLRFRGTKYFPYFIVLALLDPLFLLIRFFLNITSFHYMPIAVSLPLLALPVKDRKYVLLAIVSVILVFPHINEYNFLAPLATITISALMVCYFIEQILWDYKNSFAIPLFLLVLIFCTIADSIKISLYYSNLRFLTKYYIWFSIFGLITTILLFYFGATRKLQLKAMPTQQNDLEEKNKNLETVEHPRIYAIDFNDPFERLTYREKQVLILLGEGYKSSEIAEKLYVSKKVIYYHCGHLKEKLNIDSISCLTRFSIENREKLTKTYNTIQNASTKK